MKPELNVKKKKEYRVIPCFTSRTKWWEEEKIISTNHRILQQNHDEMVVGSLRLYNTKIKQEKSYERLKRNSKGLQKDNN